MVNGKRNYLAYLLRLWRSAGKGKETWRISLQEVNKGERLGFTSLEDMIAFLYRKMGAEQDVSFNTFENDELRDD